MSPPIVTADAAPETSSIALPSSSAKSGLAQARSGARHCARLIVFPRWAACTGRSMTKELSEKTLDAAQDMHTRAEGLTHLMAKAEIERRRTEAQLRATAYMLVLSVAAAISAASAAIAAGVAAYVALGGRL